MKGQHLSHYLILDEISRGGMGIVYRARDIKLDREVALKVLPPELVRDETRKRRFVTEAKAAAALNHPNIAVIHEIDDDDGTTFIAMELIEGDKLADVLARDRLPLSRALSMALEITEGLSIAHEKGIVHRDLKPGNIMITRDGHVKIIDFGLAKLVELADDEHSGAQTRVKGDTLAGQILGTVSYMSPEQARGQAVDHRTDVFSFGVTLYEMLTGDTPFQGPSRAETMSAIINTPAPPLSRTLQGPMVPELSRVVERCLEKDPEDRYQTARDLLSDLRRVKRDSDSGARTEAVGPTVRSPVRLPWIVAGGVVVLGVLAGIFWHPGSGEEEEPVPRLVHPRQVTSAVGVEDEPAWSPDGQTLAYTSDQSGNLDIWVTQVGSGQHLNRTADYEGPDRDPSWSPDGREIVFSSDRDGYGVYTMSPLAGPPRRVATGAVRRFAYPQWSPAKNLLSYVVPTVPGEFLFETLDVSTGSSKRVALPGNGTWRHDLRLSPDGRFVAYTDGPTPNPQVTRTYLLRLADEKVIPITNGRWSERSPSFSADGRFLYFVSNMGGAMDLWRQHLADDGTPIGDPQPMTTGIGMRRAVFSADGTKLAYSQGRLVGNLWRVPILKDRPATWKDATQLTFDRAWVEFVDVSPDGKRLVLSSDRAGNPDLWLMPAEGGEMQQLTTDPTPDWLPRWSPDGTQIAFYAYRSGNRDIWVMPAEGGPARQITTNPAPDYHPSWSPDGTKLAFWSTREGNLDAYMIPAAGWKEERLSEDPGADLYPTFSPDGHWLVTDSAREGPPLRLFLLDMQGGAPRPLTKGAGGFPVFSRDGKRVFFTGIGRAGNLWTVSLNGTDERPVTDLSGKRGELAPECLATDGTYLYFTWEQDVGDIWVMDVAEAQD